MIIPKVSIIIVNWNGETFLGRCFASLYNSTFEDFEVIFVDNGSTDNSVNLASLLMHELNFEGSIIRLPENIGFTGGNIEGLRHSVGRYIVLLNNDTEVTNVWLERLVQTMDSRNNVGICGSKQIIIGTRKIDEAGHLFSNSLNVYGRGKGKDIKNYSIPEYVPSVCAAAAIYRKSMLDEIGFFDEDFFLDYEDIDLAFRAQLAGWKVFYEPTAIVYHYCGSTKDKIKKKSEYYNQRNKKLTFLKNLPLILFFYFLPCFIIGELESVLWNIKLGNFKGYINSWIDFFRKFKLYLRKRREVMKLKRVSNCYIKGLFSNAFKVYWNRYSKTLIIL
jgi:GT2 family glycosyltransferase